MEKKLCGKRINFEFLTGVLPILFQNTLFLNENLFEKKKNNVKEKKRLLFFNLGIFQQKAFVFKNTF